MFIRWIIRRDIPAIMDIERASFEFPWCEDELLAFLRKRTAIGVVAEKGEGSGIIRGYGVYELRDDHIELVSMAVDPLFRRQGVGHLLVNRLKDKLSAQRRRSIGLVVRETNLPAQLFFAEMGFRAVSIQRNYYDDNDESAYIMRIRVNKSEKPVTNRISHLHQ